MDTTTPTSVRIYWADSPDLRGSDLIDYRIWFIQKDGSLVLDTTNCDGTTALIKTNKECFVPMTTFINTHNLVLGDLIQVQVEA